MSRQREWQKKQVAAGNCMICGKPRQGASRFLCQAHLELNRRLSRERKRAVRRKEATHAP